MNVLDKVQRKR